METKFEIVPGMLLTTERAESSYGIPVLVFEGKAYGPSDLMPVAENDPLPWLRQNARSAVIDAISSASR